MRRFAALAALLIAASSIAGAAQLTVRQRLQEALDKTLELRAKAVSADPDVLGQLALMYGESPRHGEGREAISGVVFPTVDEIKAYAAVRPAATLYMPLRCSRVSYVKDRVYLPTSAALPFSLIDERELCRLLRDSDPAIRSLAIESLAALGYPEDIPRIAALLDDPAPGAPSIECNQQMSAQYVGAARTTDDATSPVFERSWRTKTVGDYASRAIYYTTGQPTAFMAGNRLDAKSFASWWAANNDPGQCLWYWQRRISLALRTIEARRDEAILKLYRSDLTPDALRKAESNLREDCDRRKRAVIDALCRELARESPDVEAKVQLLAIWDEDPLNGPANGSGIAAPVLKLRLTPERLLELLEQKNVWPDVDWSAVYGRLVERIALNTHILRRCDVPRLRTVYAKNGSVAMLICISRLLPAAKAYILDAFDTRDGCLRAGIRSQTDSYAQGRLAAELVSVGLPANWPFLKDRFFAETGTDCCIPNLRDSIIAALGQGPLTSAKRAALVDLVTDERFRPLWTQYNTDMGDDRYREGAAAAINAHAGKELITYQEKQAMVDPATSEKTLAEVLEKARSLASVEATGSH